MCGRYSLIADIADPKARFDFHGGDIEYAPRPSYNIAPTQGVMTVVDGAPRLGGYTLSTP